MESIGVDLDGIVYDIEEEMLVFYNRLRKYFPVLSRDTWTEYYLRVHSSLQTEQDVLAQFGQVRLYKTLRMIPQAQSSLVALSKRFNIIIATHRAHIYPEAVNDTIESLRRDQVPFTEVLFDIDKANLARRKGLRFFIEDNPRNASEISSVCPCYLFDYPYNRVIPPNRDIVRVPGFQNKEWWQNFQSSLCS
jgi:uncharacterized HAD superfamily protein